MGDYKIQDTPLQFVKEAAVAYNSPYNRVAHARQGVTIDFVQNLISSYQFSKQELCKLIDVSTKTLDRHIASQKGFSGLQAERLIHLSALYHHGVEVFGDSKKFLKWMSSSVVALNSTSPKSWLDTRDGIDLIMDEIGRIHHGVLA